MKEKNLEEMARTTVASLAAIGINRSKTLKNDIDELYAMAECVLQDNGFMCYHSEKGSILHKSYYEKEIPGEGKATICLESNYYVTDGEPDDPNWFFTNLYIGSVTLEDSDGNKRQIAQNKTPYEKFFESLSPEEQRIRKMTDEERMKICDMGYYNDVIKGYLIEAMRYADFTNKDIVIALNALKVAFDFKNASQAREIYNNFYSELPEDWND